MAEELKVNIIGDASQLKGALGQAGGQVESFSAKIGKIGKTMTVVGGAVTAALGAIVMKTAAVGDKFDKMSLRTGISVEALSSLAYAADISGTSIETMEKGLKGLTMTMDDYSKGIGEAKDAYEELNISVTDADGNLRDTVDVFKEIATKISAIENPTKQASIAIDIFGGRAGPQLLPMLKMGEKGIDDLMRKAEELGISLSTKEAKAAAEFTDRLTDLKGSVAGVGREIGFVLMPILTDLAEKVIVIIKKVKDWAEAHEPLVKLIVTVGAAVGALALVGGPILMAISVISKLKVAIVAVGAAIKVVTIAMASNPLGLAILATGALYTAWVTNFAGIRDFTLAVVDGVKKALGWLWDKIEWLGKKLGLFKKDAIDDFDELNQEITESTGEVAKAAGEAATAIGTETTAMGEAIEPTNTFATANETLATNLGKVADKAKEASEKIKIYAEDVAENYIALSIEATKSWAAFYEFWEADAKRTSKVVEETVKKHAQQMYYILNELAEVVGITNIPQVAPGQELVPMETTPTTSTINNIPVSNLVTPATKGGSTYSPTVQVTVQGNGNAGEIKKAVEQALDESARQFSRRGFEMVPGIG